MNYFNVMHFLNIILFSGVALSILFTKGTRFGEEGFNNIKVFMIIFSIYPLTGIIISFHIKIQEVSVTR